MELAVGLLAGVCVWTFLARLVPRRDRLVVERVAALARAGAGATSVLRRRVGRPRLQTLGRRLPGDRLALQRTLASAGLEERSPDSVIGARFLFAAFGAVLGVLFGPLAPVSGAALGFAGYRLPDFLISVRISSRRDEIAADLPDTVDLLTVCTQAGLNLPLALARVAERAPGVLGEELRRTVRQSELGVPRARALKELAERNEVEELDALVSTLVSSGRFGTRIAATLNSFSTEIRAKRRRKAEEEARRAPVKILFPLVFLILPAFILLTLVPLLIGTFASLGF